MPDSQSISMIGLYAEQGFVVLRGLLPVETVVAARDTYEALYEDATTVLPVVDSPILVMWYHAVGGAKRYALLNEVDAIAGLVANPAILAPVRLLCGGPVRLLETILFNKPPGGAGGKLAWHQDAAFYPVAGGDQVSACVVLDPVVPENGAISFAVGSHRESRVTCAVDLHSGDRLSGDVRTAADPVAAGFPIATPELNPGDVILFHSLTWHGSGPNLTNDRQRRLISIRYVSLDTRHEPVAGNAASFIHQIATPPGLPLSGDAFPIL